MSDTGKRTKTLPPDSISVFCTQLALILKAGTTLREGISALASDGEGGASAGRALYRVISSIDGQVGEGKSLSEALRESRAFPDYMAGMVLIGEKTGKLDDVLLSLSEYYERAAYLNSRIRGSLIYPAFLFAVMTAVIILLVGKVFPIFEDMLSQLGGSLSDGAHAASAFSAGILAGKYTMAAMLTLTAAAVLILVISRTRYGRELLGRAASLFPPTRRISSKVAASRFSSALSLTLSSGMDLRSALEFASGVVDSPSLKKKFDLCLSESDSGKPLHKAVQAIGVFSPINVKFIEVGQRSGSVDEVMGKIAQIYEAEADSEINGLTSFIESAIVGVLSVVIGIILISVMLPLVSIMSGL